jgi:hypothetical protein
MGFLEQTINDIDWMFSLAFAAHGSGAGATLQRVGLNMNFSQVCLYHSSSAATTIPHTLVDLELMFCTGNIC